MEFRVQDGVWGLGCGGSDDAHRGFRVQDGMQGLMCGVQDGVWGVRFRVQGLGRFLDFRFQGSGCGVGFRV